MNLGLVHNADAGSNGDLSPSDLVCLIERHGHHVVATASPSGDWSAILAGEVDGIVAAGGDGTVASVARDLSGSPLPLLVLPLGTANNIAASLGLPAELSAVLARWESARRRPLDLAVATGPWGERLMVESVGGGLVAHGTIVMDRQEATDPSPEDALARALDSYRDVLRVLEPVPWELSLDGEEMSGDFLCVEVLNMGSIGPNFVPTPDADWSDGHLSVVLADASHRAALTAYIEARREGRPAALDLPVRLAREVVIRRGDRLHLDDEVFGEPGTPGVTVRIVPAALDVLV